MEELYYGSVIVWYGYTVGVSQCDSVELLKCDSCGGVILCKCESVV